MNKASLLKWAVLAVVLGLVVALAANSCQSERRVRQANEAKATAEHLRSIAEAGRSAALARLAEEAKKVKVIRQVDTVLATRVLQALAATAPDTCKQYVEPLQKLVVDQQAQIGKWRGVWEDQSAATDALLVVVDTLRASNDKLSKAVTLLQPQRFDILGRLLHPSIKPAVFVGVCSNGHPCVGGGIAITF